MAIPSSLACGQSHDALASCRDDLGHTVRRRFPSHDRLPSNGGTERMSVPMSAETDHLPARSGDVVAVVPLEARLTDHDPGHADVLVVGERPDRLLVVDDALAGLGHGVVFARSIVDALRQVSRRDFAAILLDADLPGADLLVTVAAIRRHQRAERTPILLLAAETGETSVMHADARGPIDVVAAPISPRVLREKVGMFVELHLLRARVAGQVEERASLAAAVAALERAEESIRRSTMLAELGLELSGVIDVRQAMHALLARIVPALADTATVATLGDDGVVEHAVTRSTLLDDVCASEEIAAARLPTAHYELLHAALALAPAERPRRTPHADGALRMLPLIDGERMRGALWVDGELTAASAALLDDIALRAVSASRPRRCIGACDARSRNAAKPRPTWTRAIGARTNSWRCWRTNCATRSRRSAMPWR